jgi:hypothetical protein
MRITWLSNTHNTLSSSSQHSTALHYSRDQYCCYYLLGLLLLLLL